MIKNVMKSFLFGAIPAAIVMAGTGFAQAKNVNPKETCHCIVPAGSTGQVLSSSGDVQVSLPQGFSPAVPGMALSRGSVILAGVRSNAQIVFGGCHLNILPLRDVSLDPVDDGICVRVTSADGRTAGFKPAAGAKPNGIPAVAIIAGVAAVGGGIAIATATADAVGDTTSAVGGAVIGEIIDGLVPGGGMPGPDPVSP